MGAVVFAIPKRKLLQIGAIPTGGSARKFFAVDASAAMSLPDFFVVSKKDYANQIHAPLELAALKKSARPIVLLADRP